MQSTTNLSCLRKGKQRAEVPGESTLQLPAQKGTRIGGNSCSRTLVLHCLQDRDYRTEKQEVPGGYTLGRMSPPWQGSAEKNNHPQRLPPAQCLGIVLSGPNDMGQASELQLAT